MKKNLFFALAFFPCTVVAQDKEIELNPVTVSASLQPTRVAKTGRNIISIPGENFQRLPVHSIDELLRYIPGVEVQQRGAAGSQSDIVLRGGTFQQVLIILDGIRLNDPNTGHFNSYIPIAPGEIDRIEVLKGASSAIYGSEAVGGVIHIITKTFAADKNKKKKELAVSTALGEYNFWSASASGFYQTKNTAIGGGIITNNTDGQPQRGTTGFFNNTTASLSLKQVIDNNWSLAIRSGYDVRDFGAQNFYTIFASDTAKEKVSSQWNQLSLNFNKGKHKLGLQTGYKSVKDIFKFNGVATANNNKSNLFQALLTDHYQWNETTLLSSGLQYQLRKINSNDRGNHSLDQAAAFLILQKKIKNFTISPSLRVDYGENRGTELVPQLNLSYNKNNWQIRGSLGKTIRDADFTERYNNNNKTLVTGGSVGNPDLIAERSFSYEMGADYFAGKNLKLSASFFQRRQSDLIDWIPTPYSQMPYKHNLSPTGTFGLAQNISEVTTSGVETDLIFTKAFDKNNHLFAAAGLVWLKSKSNNATPSFYLSSHARFMHNFILDYSYRNLSLSVTGIYKQRNPQNAPAIHAEVSKNYFVVNTKASISLLSQRLNVFVRVDNIGHVKYSDLLGSAMPGRWLMGGVSWRFF